MKTANKGLKFHRRTSVALEDFDYPLTPDRIAQVPAARRDQSRLLVLNRSTGRILHRPFRQIERYFCPGDLLVVNDSRVWSCRLYGWKPTGGKVQLLLLSEAAPGQWKGLVRNVDWDQEAQIRFANADWEATVEAGGKNGVRTIRFNRADVQELMDFQGQMPLPGYINREDTTKAHWDEKVRADWQDRLRYQTIFADRPGSAAAPTAGLHFSSELLDRLMHLGVKIVPITLHVGYGTFRPIDSPDVREHQIHPEQYRISRLAARFINEGRARGGKVFAVGTTVVRALEYASDAHGDVIAGSGWNDLYICGDYRFKVVNHLITNFHLPKSSLLVLVSSFAGRDKILRAYREAMDKDYRFYSYGDAMLIL